MDPHENLGWMSKTSVTQKKAYYTKRTSSKKVLTFVLRILEEDLIYRF